MNWKTSRKMTPKKKKAVKMLNTVMAMDTAEMMMEAGVERDVIRRRR